MNPDGLANILEDIRKSGKHITKLVWTSPKKLSSIELKPQFESEPNWLNPVKVVANKNNQIVMDLSKEEFDPDFVDHLKYYILNVDENLEKLGVIVYGYVN